MEMAKKFHLIVIITMIYNFYNYSNSVSICER